MNAKVFLFLVLFTKFASAQGYAGLGQEAPGFALPDPNTRLEFPADDGAHEDFRVEWWYITANLTNPDGNAFGIQWTLFRTALRPGSAEGWNSPQLWMAHAAATSANYHGFAEKFARGGTGQAGAMANPFEVWIDDWVLSENASGALSLKASGPGFSYELNLIDTGGYVLHGDQGYSVKSLEGQASHYYSRPFLDVTGTITVDGDPTAVSGTAWLDREWSSQPLSGDQSGWDWVGLTLDDGRRLMAARVRGESESYHFGSLIEPDGSVTTLGTRDVALTPIGQKVPPTSWSVRVPDHEIDLSISALNQDAWTGELFSYWEGPVSIRGSQGGSGYLEMTGYPKE